MICQVKYISFMSLENGKQGNRHILLLKNIFIFYFKLVAPLARLKNFPCLKTIDGAPPAGSYSQINNSLNK